MTPPPRERPPYTADERTQLVGWLDMQRAVVQWKCADLSDENAHRALLPTSPLMTMAGLVAHLTWVEHLWFEHVFLGRPERGPRAAADAPDSAEMRVDGVPLAQLLAEYERQCAVSNEIIAGHALDDTGRAPGVAAREASLRWILFHLIEETARHAGHMDTIRESLDGAKGYY
ncbi:DinB family protein [Streptomyces sp. 71268]|uniref:DinB family protein n=1 Tax=Streptomyces sp. 71268 TaxID=3002640 RepID=UPI0023F99ADC|nr:DinB family protein [Streptomyces sp. 71268]WEV28118.1 DinB family protein [Streptomyces sp. 71268]